MNEAQVPGQGEWRKAQIETPPDFHLDPNKTEDPTEKLIEKLGPAGAFDELADQLPPNTDKEVVRQMKLILNKVIKQNQH